LVKRVAGAAFKMRKKWALLSVSLIWALAEMCFALEPHEILVLANRNAAKSVGLAKYYMERRGIPEKNLLQLWSPTRNGARERTMRKEWLLRCVNTSRGKIRSEKFGAFWSFMVSL